MKTSAERQQTVGEAIAERIEELGVTIPTVARAANVHPSTVRDLIHGKHWPRESTRDALNAALGWPLNHITALAVGLPDLAEVRTVDMLNELCRRAEATERARIQNIYGPDDVSTRKLDAVPGRGLKIV